MKRGDREYQVSGHGIYYLKYHVVWVSKYRRKILNPGLSKYIQKVLQSELRSLPGVLIETIGFDSDHVHIVMQIPPKYSIKDTMARLKSQSSKQARKKFKWLEKVYWKENILWSPGYFVSSVGVNEETIRNYVIHQGEKDSGQQKLLL